MCAGDFERVDIGGDPRAGGGATATSIPVVEIDGERAFTYFVQPDALRQRLTGLPLTVPSGGRREPWAQCDAAVTNEAEGIELADRLTVGVAARLSRYLQVLTQAKKMGKDRISSQEISDYTNINATQIRRDLSGFGKFGKRGVGYNIESLLGEIRKILRTQGQHNIALVGAGRLGQAIASSPIFAEHGINIAAVLDTDPEKAGRAIGNLERAAVREPARRRCARTTSSSACSPCRRTAPSGRRTT